MPVSLNTRAPVTANKIPNTQADEEHRRLDPSGVGNMGDGTAVAPNSWIPPSKKAERVFATAEVKNGAGVAIGSVQLSQTKAGVEGHYSMSNLPPGKHGFHVHGVGKCEGPSFSSAGSHLNPGGSPHGEHLGDLPNIDVGKNGTAKGHFLMKDATLSPGPRSLRGSEGTSFIVHANLDDGTAGTPATGPGNSGARLACGVITDYVKR